MRGTMIEVIGKSKSSSHGTLCKTAASWRGKCLRRVSENPVGSESSLPMTSWIWSESDLLLFSPINNNGGEAQSNHIGSRHVVVLVLVRYVSPAPQLCHWLSLTLSIIGLGSSASQPQ